MKSKPVLIWAVDPIEKETRPSAASMSAIRRWAKEMGWEIQPVTVVTPSVKELERGLLGAVSRYQEALDSYVAKLRIRKKGRVLVNEENSQAAAVAKLLRFARVEGARAIAVSSHGRSGFDRLVLGSFAEKVLETSPLPVFFLNHRPARLQRGRQVALFPTNFSGESWAAYREFLGTAAGRKFDLVLFHSIPYPIPPAGMGVYLPDGYVDDQEKWAIGEARRWVDEAKRRGVKAEAVIRTGGIGFVSGDAVLGAIKEFGASAVVMTASSSAASRLLLGSVAYPVFRANKALALVYGPKAIGMRNETFARASV